MKPIRARAPTVLFVAGLACTVVAATADLVPAQQAGAIPSGRYACDFPRGGSTQYVEIRGGTYRAFTDSGPFRPYVMGAGNSVTWTAGFGEFTVVSTQYIEGGRPAFFVTYSRTHGGGVERVDCLRE